jgi:hypothetical protein
MKEPKIATEDCVSLRVVDVLRAGLASGKVAIRWFSDEDEVAAIWVATEWGATSPRAVLTYLVAETGLPIQYSVPLQCTPTQYSGRRWWLTCTLASGGTLCGRRCGKLYLPSDQLYFGCRRCHDLTYRSVQTAHLRD